MYRMSDYVTYGGNEDQHQPLLNRYLFSQNNEAGGYIYLKIEQSINVRYDKVGSNIILPRKWN